MGGGRSGVYWEHWWSSSLTAGRKDVCVSALLHTRGEAVCRCQSCQRLGSLSPGPGLMAEQYPLSFDRMESLNHQFDRH